MAPSLAVRVTFACEALPSQVKVGPQVTPYSARVRRCTRCQKLNHTTKRCRQTTQTCPRCGGRGHGGEGCSAPLSRPNCSGPHSAAWLRYPEYRTYLLANKIKAQTYMLHNHAIRQAKQISHNHTDNTGNKRITRTVPHTSQSDYTQNQPQTATQKTQLRKHG